MAEPSLTPLTDQALARLRKLADGNTIAPENMTLFGTEEKIYTLKGTLTLRPKCDVETGRYPGPARGGKGRQIMPNLEALHIEVQSHKDKFQSGRRWIDASLEELKAAPGNGWGLEGAQITLPEQSIVLTASTGCPTCRGQKLTTCPHCHGRGTDTCHVCHGQRQERCYACGGTGLHSQHPNQPCTVCNGRRYITCRHCNGTGQTTCPTCHGRRGIACTGCNGTGLVSEEIGLSCSAETHFVLDSQGLPSGLRNGLGRFGIANLGKGHADITVLPPKDDEKAEATNGHNVDNEKSEKIATHSIDYEAVMPYADLRVNLDGVKAVVSVFGKRGVLLGVPNFLDKALKPAREKLALAAAGTAAIETALTVRALREALQLELNGKGTVNELRRLYPVGLSQETMREILGNLRLTLKRQTVRTRGMAAVFCSLVSAGIFAGIFLTSLHAGVTQNWKAPLQLLFDCVVLAAPMSLSWFALNLATRFELQRRFHNHTVALKQTTGKTGYAMLAAIVVIYAVCLIIAPVKPGWLSLFGLLQ